jgi:hypothetical protein
MLYGIILALHIAAACITMAIIAGAAYALFTSKHAWYKPVALSLAAIAALQVMSGIVMIGLNPELSALKVGLHLAIYLSVCLLVEGALYLKARTVAWTY